MISINKELYDENKIITVWDFEIASWLPLDRKLEQLKFTNEQIDF